MLTNINKVIFILIGISSVSGKIDSKNIEYDEEKEENTHDEDSEVTIYEIVPTTVVTECATEINEIDEHIESTENSLPDENIPLLINNLCPKFKEASGIEIDGMLDVWEPVYYQMPQKIPCFKMLIRRISEKEKNLYFQMYGNFNETVRWSECNLEIKSSFVASERKHFLQGSEEDHGVFENVVIEQDAGTVHLVHEGPDQWLSLENLLLLRDCFTDEVVVFAKVPYQPKLEVIKEALLKFGSTSNGKWACNHSNTLSNTYRIDDEYEIQYKDVVNFK